MINKAPQQEFDVAVKMYTDLPAAALRQLLDVGQFPSRFYERACRYVWKMKMSVSTGDVK